jgi:predicted MFS family arabinose efflux permease
LAAHSGMQEAPELDKVKTVETLDHEVVEGVRPAMSLRRYMVLVGWGLVVTTLGQMKSLGLLPTQFLLKTDLKLSATEMAGFMSLAILPWSFKPIAGLVADGLPLLGSRRKSYLVLGAGGAGLLWLALGMVPRTFQSLLVTAFLLNVAMVVASTVVGGLLVEGAQTYRATGLLSSLRLLVINVAGIGASFVGGYLATLAFQWTSFVAAALCLSMMPITLLLLREPRLPRRTGSHASVLWGAWERLVAVLRARSLWIAGGLFFLVQISPGLWTPLFYYQTNTLHFSSEFIGTLGVISGIMGLLGSFVYPVICRHLRLRVLLALAIICTVASNVAYLGYVSARTAMIIEGAAGLGLTLAQLPLFDLAARATPKGSEALAYSLMIAFWNLGLSLSDVLGSWLFDRFGQTFMNLVWVNAGTTAAVLVVIPFLPARLVDRKEGQPIDSA